MNEIFFYYIVYEVWENGKSRGKGCLEAESIKEIISLNDIKEIERGIKVDMSPKFDNARVLILSFTLLRKEK